ncbi:MAG TPA: hypothetical protein VED19_01865 [Candidatus Nitrosopolaris sp.]|nr:hypothetical protein [Candidatus Nitrosopolaris sp.]
MKKSVLKVASLAALLALAQNLVAGLRRAGVFAFYTLVSGLTVAWLVVWGSATATQASEDEPRRPFAEWADVPLPGQLIFGTLYEQSEAYHVWEMGNDRMPANFRTGDENYGIDVRQGYFTFDYGITEKWAADLNIGATTVGWRPFDNGNIQKTTGLMDTTFGVRYQIFNETNNDTGWPWLPTLTFRAGAIVPGVYDRHVAFAPGDHGVAIEPSILLREHVGWPGFGVWGDVLYRWEHTIGADQYIVAAGIFQQIKGWELDAGCRHLQTISGEDIVLGPPTPGQSSTYQSITYPTDVRENSDSFDAGFSYTTSKKHWRYGFHCRKTFDGSNTDSAFWLGAYVDIPFTIVKKAP